jgi:hypothetical protein
MSESSGDDGAVRLELGDFTPHIGSKFELQLDEGSQIMLELLQAKDLDIPSRPATFRVPFSLLFVGPAEFELPQRLYRLRHPELSQLTLFLVPIAREKDGMRYEAVFN